VAGSNQKRSHIYDVKEGIASCSAFHEPVDQGSVRARGGRRSHGSSSLGMGND
jgi:hypothetical protein